MWLYLTHRLSLKFTLHVHELANSLHAQDAQAIGMGPFSVEATGSDPSGLGRVPS